MTVAKRAYLGLTGLILGAAASWALSVVYLSLGAERGELAVPFGLVLVGGMVLARRRQLREVGLGLIAGAAIETSFFLWLFNEFSGGLAGL